MLHKSYWQSCNWQNWSGTENDRKMQILQIYNVGWRLRHFWRFKNEGLLENYNSWHTFICNTAIGRKLPAIQGIKPLTVGQQDYITGKKYSTSSWLNCTVHKPEILKKKPADKSFALFLMGGKKYIPLCQTSEKRREGTKQPCSVLFCSIFFVKLP